MAKKRPNDVLRTIQFFRIYSATQGEALVRFSASKLCKRITALEAMPDPYLREDDIDSNTTAYLAGASDTDRLILARSRFRSRPLTVAGKVRSPLRLKAGEGLCEPIHVRFFGNNVMAAEYNDAGPRATKLRSLLGEKFPHEYGDLKIEPLYDKEAIERLQQLRELTLLEFSVDRAALDLSKPPGNFYDALKPAADKFKSTTVSLVLKVNEPHEKLDRKAALEAIKWVLGLSSGVHSLKVKGRPENGRAMVDLDLLHDRLVAKSRFLRINPTAKIVDDADAFLKMEKAYKEVKDRIADVEIITQSDG